MPSDNKNRIDKLTDAENKNVQGKVYLIGFGPGDAELLTVKAVKILKTCDIIFYDNLLDQNYLTEFKAEKIFVGKRKDYHSKEQNEINQLLVESSKKGKLVVRLKGGDPMLFAHGGEELEFLAQHNVEAEVIPGISTAFAAAANSKIPLTFRNVSSSVYFATGHSKTLANIPKTGTLVFYMGATNIKLIAEKVIETGRNKDTEVALIHNVSLPDEELTLTTLNKILLDDKLYPTPLLIIVGEVVSLKTKSSLELAKPKLVLTGTNSLLYNAKFEIIHYPLIKISPLEDYKELDKKISEIANFDFIIFTSRFAVNHFFKRLNDLKLDIRNLAALEIVSIGAITTAELHKYGIQPDLIPETDSSKGLIKTFKSKKITGMNILIPRSDMALPILPEGLTKLGNNVETVIAYFNEMPLNLPSIDNEKFDALLFSSPSCVDNYFKINTKLPDVSIVYVRGEQTHKRLLTYGRFEGIKISTSIKDLL